MNNLVTNYPQILQFAASQRIPLNRSRAIIREYLQSNAIATLYSQPESAKLSFTGGTSLRLLRGIDRFSEDLDFDNLGLTAERVNECIATVTDRYRQENIEVELHTTHRDDKHYYELRFPNLLFDLKISTNPREKLAIKIDYTSFWKGHKPETVLFTQYGFVERVVTNPLNHLLVQKLTAYVQRKRTQPRDIYDIIWLYGQGARFDWMFAESNGVEEIIAQAREKFSREGITNVMEHRLTPFLFSEQHIGKLKLLPDVLHALEA